MIRRKDIFKEAQQFLSCRKFAQAIKLLECYSDKYYDSFRYNLLLAIAYLYLDDRGNAAKYIRMARSMRNVSQETLSLTRAALALRRGDTAKALSLYLEVLDINPGNKTAKDAIDFIKDNDSYDTICEWCSNRKLWKFYPPLGANPALIFAITTVTLMGLAAGVAITLVLTVGSKPKVINIAGSTTNFALEKSEKRAITKDIAGSYSRALSYFQKEEDNHCLHEINLILASDTQESVKTKTSELKTYIQKRQMTIDDLLNNKHDNFDYSEVSDDHKSFIGCYILWTGSVTNLIEVSGATRFDLMLSSPDKKNIYGIIPVIFKDLQKLDAGKPIDIFAKISDNTNTLILDALSFHQKI